jgi:hypothetical protein
VVPLVRQFDISFHRGDSGLNIVLVYNMAQDQFLPNIRAAAHGSPSAVFIWGARQTPLTITLSRARTLLKSLDGVCVTSFYWPTQSLALLHMAGSLAG